MYPKARITGAACDFESFADDMISLQSKYLGHVDGLGPRMFGWTDTKAALETLTRWAYIAGIPHWMDARVPSGKVWLSHDRLLAFAKTISASRLPVRLVLDWLETLLLQVEGADSENSESEIENGLYLPAQIADGGSISFSESPLPPPESFSKNIELATDGRVFFKIRDSRTCTMGLGPASIRISDDICLFPDTPTPFVVRRHKEGKASIYQLIGDCLLDTDEDALFPEKANNESPIEGSLPVEIFYSAYPDKYAKLITLA